MRIGGHVRVDAQGNSSNGSQPRRAFGKNLEFRFALDVEQENVGLEGGGDLVAGLADAGEDHSPGRGAVCGEHAFQFSARNHVKPASRVGEQAQNVEI